MTVYGNRHRSGLTPDIRNPQPKQDVMPRRMIAVVVGILFLVQMVTAMIGTSLIQAFVDGDTARAPMTIGVLFMMGSGLAVVGIGLLMYPVLKVVNQRLAIWYPILRIVEFIVSTARRLPPGPAAGGPEPPAVDLRSDWPRGPAPDLPALRLPPRSASHRRSRSARIRTCFTGSAARPRRRARHEQGGWPRPTRPRWIV